MIVKEFSNIFEMSVAQRILLVEEIWDSIAENPEAVPLTDSQKLELERRLTSYHENPGAGSPWTEVREKILASK
jgi:putative addiction module component (TIGR02574 family)